MRKIMLLLVFVVFTCISTGCGDINTNKDISFDYTKLIDNDTYLDTLIDSTIDRSMFEIYKDSLPQNDKSYYIEDIQNRIGIKFLRENNNMYYSVYKLNNDKYLYVFFEKTNGKLVLKDIIDRTEEYLKSDFDFVKIGVTTEKEIMQFDPSSAESELTGIRTTSHKLASDELIEFTYDNNDRVIDISYAEKVGVNYYSYILPKDIR
jgi:hypothetical protein